MITTLTDARICFGILLTEYIELPWRNDLYDYDLEEYWLFKVMGFKPTVEIDDDDDENGYLSGVKPAKEIIDACRNEKFAFKKANPCPFTMINAQHSDYPVWIIATNDSILNAERGEPTAFDPYMLKANDSHYKLLIDFCATHGIDIGDETPKWWLSSYWG